MLPRRGFLALGAAGIVMAPSLLRAAGREETHFSIWRKGAEIGSHSVILERSEGALTSRVEIDIAVKVAFITAFSFKQTSVDHWERGTLVRSEIHTDDDGKRTELNLEAEANGLLVDGPDGEVRAPLGLMTDLCFWNRDIVKLPQLIDSSRGEVASVTSEHLGRETIELPGQKIEAEHFRLASSRGRSGDIWYDDNGRWVKSNIVTRGETLEYQLIA